MMCKKIAVLVCFGLVIGLSASAAMGGISYLDPAGGWTYIYTGDQAAYDNSVPTNESLDGWWGHNDLSGGDSDSWDGSPIGSGNFGGVMSITEGNVTFLRIQDAGDPRDHAPNPGDPSNRKLMFTHELARDGIDAAATILDSGVTLSFRARVATTGPLDPLKGDGGSPTGPWPAGGDGYVVHHEGKGNFGIRQNTGDAVISFCLVLAGDAHTTKIPAGRQGLCTNNLNGTSPSGDVDIEGNDAGTLNLLDIADPTQWHEFWIHIVADTSGGGTHKVTIWMDGNTGTPDGTFHVTAGNGNDEDYSYLEMGCGSTAQYGAFDADFFAYKPGLIAPVPSNPNLARAVNPAPGAIVGANEAVPLEWLPGASAKFHDVYFGMDKADVNNADISTTGIYRGRQSAAIYVPSEALEFGKTYYWRIDQVEANGTTIYKGDVWSFTIRDHLIVDDCEDYNDQTNLIYLTWIDGYGSPAQGIPGNGTGSTVGNTDPPYAERTIVHDGSQSMPLAYNNSGPAKLSEASAKIDDLKSGRDWATHGVKMLSLWFRGYPAYAGSFVEAPAGTFTMKAGGADIWGTSDQFHFAFKEVSGASTVVAKVLSVSNTDPWAKAGVMIRDSLDPASTHAMVVVTPGSGVAMQYRSATGGSSETVTQAGIVAPQWVKIERTLGGLIRGYYSADGVTWTQLGDVVGTVIMDTPMYVGLALTSHNVNETCVAQFSDVSFPGTSVGAQWSGQDIGIISNEAVPMYVAISNPNGTPAVVYHEDPNATLISTWTEWPIDLKKFADKGVNLANVDKIFIGFGTRENPQPGGTGKMFFDDIGLYQPKCVLSKLVGLEADFTDDCVVDIADLEIMAADWLDSDFTRPGPLLVHYKLDEGAGTVAADSSSNGNNGAFSGTATWAPGRGGGFAAAFDGGVGQVTGDGTYLNGLSALSFGAWIKSSVVGTDAGAIIFTDPDGTDQRDIRYDSAGSVGGGTNVIKYGVATEEGSHENESASNVQTTEWQHVMVTWTSGQAAKLYINGVLDTPTALDGVIGGTTTGYTTVIVGRGGKDASGSWNGLVDDVRVYEVALTAAQVQTVMNGGNLPVVDVYVPLVSIANLYDAEPQNQKKVNFKDFAILADQWLKQVLWP